MTQSFKCPSCSAPLKFQGTMVQTCKFCGGDVIVPADLAKPKEEIFEAKPLVEAESLTDTSELGQKALKIAEIKRAIKENRKMNAAILFRDSFGGSLSDAREIIQSIESGESVYVPDFRTGKKSSSSKRIIFFVIAAIAVILFLMFGVRLFLVRLI